MKTLMWKYSSICLLTLLGCTTTPSTLTTSTHKKQVDVCAKFSYLGYKDCKKESHLYIVSNDRYDALMSPKGEILTPYKYVRLEAFGKDLFREALTTWEAPDIDSKEPVMMHGYVSHKLISSRGKEIISKEDTVIELDTWGSRHVIKVKSPTSTAIYTLEGEVLIPFGEYESIRYEEGFVQVTNLVDGDKGYIDTKGNEVIPPKYNSISYEHGYFYVQSKGGNGLYDGNGKIIILPKYIAIDFIGNGLFKVEDKNSNVGLFNDKGKILAPCKFNGISGSLSKKGYILISDLPKKYCGGFNKLYDTKKKKIIPLFLDKDITGIHGFKYGSSLVAVQKNDKWGFIDSTSKLIIPYQYNEIDDYYR